MAIQIQLRRGTAAAWTSANPTLASGELGVETDTDKFKIGDGATAWNSLAYVSLTALAHNLGGNEHSADTLANLNSKINDATLIDTGDSRLSDSRTCNNSFDNAATARTNLEVYSTTEVDGKVVGLYDHKGAYDADTNTPDLDVTPITILKGDAYTVSVAGTFFTEAVEIGDVLIADQNSPTQLSHWTRVNKNISFGSSAGTACEGNDSRLSDARTPAAHASSHTSGADDIQNATTEQKGLMTSAYATKLEGIEAAADVTDATNVNSAGAVMHSDISQSEGFLRKTGSETYIAIKSNMNASVAPSANEDSADGYAIGSRWFDTTADKEYVCLDATESAAVWRETTASSAGEANTTSNSGAGEGTLALAKSGINLPFKTLKQGANVTLINNSSDVTIVAKPSFEFSWDSLVDLTGIDYTQCATFIFRGTGVMGAPTAIKVLCYQTSTDARLRIMDITNSLQICESAAFTHTDPGILSMGTLSNLPSGEAVWSLEYKENGSGKVYISAMSLQF